MKSNSTTLFHTKHMTICAFVVSSFLCVYLLSFVLRLHSTQTWKSRDRFCVPWEQLRICDLFSWSSLHYSLNRLGINPSTMDQTIIKQCNHCYSTNNENIFKSTTIVDGSIPAPRTYCINDIVVDKLIVLYKRVTSCVYISKVLLYIEIA